MAKHVRAVNFSSGITMALMLLIFWGGLFDNIVDGH